MDLMPHNQQAYDAVVEHLKKSNRTCVVHPTGTGKSYIALQLIENNPDKRILYITSLSTNLLEFWDKVDKLGGRRMVLNLSNISKYVGSEIKGDLDVSDTLAGKSSTENGENADDQDTDATDILAEEEKQRLLKRATVVDESHLKGPLIQFCLYAGLENLLPDFDLIIVDEFHRAGAILWEQKVKNLLDENVNAKIVGFSATPERMDGRDMRALFNNDVASEMQLSESIVNGLLPLPKYWLGKIEMDRFDTDDPSDPDYDEKTDRKTRRSKKDGKRKLQHPIVAKRHLEAGDGLREAFQEALIPENAEHGKFIVFCRTIDNTRTLVKASEEWFDWVDDVHRYEMHSLDRDGYFKFVNDDSDSLRLLFVVDMLTEGVHLKDLDGIIMVRPTESERVYFQQLGRALAVTTRRAHPLIFDIVSNAAVMKGGMDFLKGVGKQMGMEEEDMDKFFHITAEAADFVAYLEETEYDYYSAMKSFYRKNGHLYIPPGYTVDGHDVYRQFCMIRGRRNSLSREFREKYEAIGMDWEITYQWMKGYWAAEQYFNVVGDLYPPSNEEVNGVYLYPWLKRNRINKDRLYQRQIDMLDAIGMDWTILDPWEEKFEMLVEFQAMYGHCDVPGDEGALGNWVAEQRKRPPEGERKEKLDQLGFEWDGNVSRKNNTWRVGVMYSRKFYRDHGHLKVPKGFVTEGYRLGDFIKRTKANGRLDELIKEVTEAEASGVPIRPVLPEKKDTKEDSEDEDDYMYVPGGS